MKAKDIMQKDVLTLRVDDDLDIVDNVMALGRIRHLPIVDRHERLVGILTQRDLLRASVASVFGLRRSTEREWLAGIPVRQVMSSDVTSVRPDAELAEVVDLMVRKKFGCLPVVEDGRLVGLVTETDCLLCLRDLLASKAEPAATERDADLEC
ncbi:MAG: CBS domain-containing protein [Deltaproteobacteria bacterium]|nr:CBS domain-containing protein [Deltaproteobacteria bacterium]